jgi:hypothetical protein
LPKQIIAWNRRAFYAPLQYAATDAKRPADGPRPFVSSWLFLLLALRMSLVGMPFRGLRVPFGTAGGLPALGMVTLAMPPLFNFAHNAKTKWCVGSTLFRAKSRNLSTECPPRRRKTGHFDWRDGPLMMNVLTALFMTGIRASQSPIAAKMDGDNCSRRPYLRNIMPREIAQESLRAEFPLNQPTASCTCIGCPSIHISGVASRSCKKGCPGTRSLSHKS